MGAQYVSWLVGSGASMDAIYMTTVLTTIITYLTVSYILRYVHACAESSVPRTQ
jgi:hypothetical protein